MIVVRALERSVVGAWKGGYARGGRLRTGSDASGTGLLGRGVLLDTAAPLQGAQARV